MTYAPGGGRPLIPRSSYEPMAPPPPAAFKVLAEGQPPPGEPALKPEPGGGVLSLENGLGNFGGRTFVLPSEVLLAVHKLVVAHIADELRKEAKALEEAIQQPDG